MRAAAENVIIGRVFDDVFFLDVGVPVADFQIFKAGFFVDALFFNRLLAGQYFLDFADSFRIVPHNEGGEEQED